MLRDILRRVGSITGLDPSDANQRITLLDYVNQAARDIWHSVDFDDNLDEATYDVEADMQIVFPYDVSCIRAIRDRSRNYNWTLRDMYKKYRYGGGCSELWTNWRVKSALPIRYPITSANPLRCEVAAVETPNVVVTITGSTATATQATDVITLNGTSVAGQVNFTTIKSITKDRASNYDVAIYDTANRLMATLPNNDIRVIYTRVDVSTYPYAGNLASMDVLFKRRVPHLSADTDTFPLTDGDDIVVNKSLQMWAENSGQVEGAMLYATRVQQQLGAWIQDMTRGQQLEISYEPTPGQLRDDCLQPTLSSRIYRASRVQSGLPYIGNY